MRYLFFIFFIIMLTYCFGCATTVNRDIPPKAVNEPTATSESVELPREQKLDMDKARQVANVYRMLDIQKVTQNFNPVILKDITMNTPFTPAYLSRCDIDTLRVLIASGWAPSVVIQTPGGQKHIRIVLGYNHPPERLALVDIENPNPNSLMELDEGYADFQKQWDRKTCVIFDRNITEHMVKLALGKYLSSEKVASIGITTR